MVKIAIGAFVWIARSSDFLVEHLHQTGTPRTVTAAFAVTGEFDNMCAQGLATGQKIKTDCSINAQIEGKTYCFGSEQAKTEFMKDPRANLAKAQATYKKPAG